MSLDEDLSCAGAGIPAPGEGLVEAECLTDLLGYESQTPSDSDVRYCSLVSPVVDAPAGQAKEVSELGRSQQAFCCHAGTLEGLTGLSHVASGLIRWLSSLPG